MLRELLSDLRFGLRTLLRSPGFTVVALVTMALGIGANTAMFSIVRGVLLRPFPYPESDRIVRVWENNLSQGWETFSLAPLNFWDMQDQNRSLEALGAYRTTMVTYTGGDHPESLPALRVSEEFLGILGGEPTLGRGITQEDVTPDVEGVVLLSHGFWQESFGGDTGILGSTLILDDLPHTVVGILPQGWEMPGGSRRDLVLPLKPEAYWYETRGSHFLQAYGRLKPGVTVEQARSDLAAVAAALEDEYPGSNRGWGATVRPLEEVVLGSTRPQLLIFMASVGLLLLIACANLANMTLARGLSRTRELAIRTALGAGRARVVGQFLSESLLLACLGGATGVAFTYLALGAFVRNWPSLLPRMGEIQVDGPVLLFSLGLSLAAGIMAGLVPALSVSGGRLGEALRQGGRSVAGDRSRRWMRSGLVTVEVALAVVLLVGSGLLVRSFMALRGENPGFQTHDRLVLAVPLPLARYGTAEGVGAFARELLPQLRAMPGVEVAALSSLIPISGDDEVWGYWLPASADDSNQDGATLFFRVSPGYFEAMGIPLLDGRDISQDDRQDGLPVVVVSESFARENFPGQRAVGERIQFGRDPEDPWVEIVGVAGEVQHYRLGDSSESQVYVPFQQHPARYINVVLKSRVAPLSLVTAVREVVRSVDPTLPLVGVQPAKALIEEAMSRPRFRTLLMGGFGVTALILAVVGLYGVMAYSVSQRTKEIGVRVALGATRRAVLGMVFREGSPLVLLGLALGLAGALTFSRILGSMLFGVGARDVAVFTVAPLLLMAVAAAAMLIPARRAARVDPVQTLAEE